MDLVASCKDKLTYFRIKELKDVLTQLGLSKQGKKQDLVDRILSILSDDRVPGVWAKKNAVGKEDVAKSIDDIYRRMQGSGATDLASKSQAVSDSSTVKPNEETIEDSYQIEKVRCLCGSSLQTESMIQCEDPKCHVWQHINCVIIPEKPMEGVLPPSPDFFNCELCRLNQADPFWLAIAHPLYPVKLSISNIPADGTNPVQSIEKNFQLTRADKDLLMKQEYDLQAWCMLLNDKVPFRMQWPQYADLQINGMPVRAINRPGSQLLGANGRDDGPIITPCTRDGINKISLTGCDARIFCLGVRIVKRRTLQQILNMIPKEAEGEPFDDALARVLRCVGGGAATEQADSDSDLEVVADFISVNLRCPMSGSRMKVAGRFKPCVHMGCFDLNVFVEMNQRSRKWQCPVCLKNYSLDKIIIDPYFNRITSKLMDCGEDVTEIEVKPDGCWRAKGEGDRRGLQELGMWHSPDGSLCLPTEVESKPNLEVLRQVKQENGSEGHAGLKLGMKKNPNGFWEIRQPDEVQKLSSGNILSDNLDNHFQNIIPMSSSDTESGINGDDASVNQTGGGGGNVDFSANNGIEFDSVSLNVNSAYAFANQNTSAAQGDADIIVLSDSDDEAEPIVVCKNNQNASSGVHLSVPTTGIPAPYNENHTVGAGSTSCLDLFNGNEDDDIGMHMWTMPSTSQGGSTFPLFNSDANVSALASVQIGAISCPTSMNNYSMTTDTPMDSAIYVPNYSGERLGGDMSNSLVDNPLAFGRNDPSLQIFLPTRASDVSSQADQIDKADVHNGVHNEDWISLSLGGSGGLGELAAENRINEVHLPSKRGTLDSLANTATSLPGMNENGLVKSSKENTDSPFHFPRQRRSVRPRLYLSIDSESE